MSKKKEETKELTKAEIKEAEKAEKLEKEVAKAEEKVKEAEKDLKKAKTKQKGGFPLGAILFLALGIYLVVMKLMDTDFSIADYGIDEWLALAPGASLIVFGLTLLPKKAYALQVIGGLIATAGHSFDVADQLQLTDNTVAIVLSIVLVAVYAMMTVLAIIRGKGPSKVFWLLPVLLMVGYVGYSVYAMLPIEEVSLTVILEIVELAVMLVATLTASRRIAK